MNTRKTLVATATAIALALTGAAYADAEVAGQQPISPEVEKADFTFENKPYYAGIAINTAETYSKGSKRGYFTHDKGEFSNAGITLTTGWLFNQREKISSTIELRVGSSFWMEDSEDITTTFAGLYYKPSYEVLRHINIYGLLGANYTNFSGLIQDKSYTQISVGLGGEITVAENLKLFGDYVFTPLDGYIDYFEDEVNFDTINVGIRYLF